MNDPGCALLFILTLLGFCAGLCLLVVALMFPGLTGPGYWIISGILFVGMLVFSISWHIRSGGV